MLLIIGITALINDYQKISPSGFILAFGVVQVISILIHLFTGKQPWKYGLLRKIHHILMLIVFAVLIYGFTMDSKEKYDMPGLEVIVYTLIPASLLALFYSVITFLEWRKMKNYGAV